MGFYDNHILPHLINAACGMGPIRRQRAKIVPRARGVVLEIGIGTGLNLPFYDADAVERLVGLDPSEASWELAARRSSRLAFPVEFIGLPGEQIPLASASVDCIVMTYSLCTIPDPAAALAGMARVLKPVRRWRRAPLLRARPFHRPGMYRTHRYGVGSIASTLLCLWKHISPAAAISTGTFRRYIEDRRFQVVSHRPGLHVPARNTALCRVQYLGLGSVLHALS